MPAYTIRDCVADSLALRTVEVPDRAAAADAAIDWMKNTPYEEWGESDDMVYAVIYRGDIDSVDGTEPIGELSTLISGGTCITWGRFVTGMKLEQVYL